VALGLAALPGLAACQPDYTSRIRSANAVFDDGRGTTARVQVVDTPSGQQNIYLDVAQRFCDRSTDELVVRRFSTDGYDAGGLTDDVEVDIPSDLSGATALLRAPASVGTQRYEGCGHDGSGPADSEVRTEVFVRARLRWTGTGPVRSVRPDVDVRDAEAEGVLRVGAPVGRVRLGPSNNAELQAFEGIEE
jgi:hypothetical protein